MTDDTRAEFSASRKRSQLAGRLAKALRAMLNDQPDDPEYASEQEWDRWERAQREAVAALREWYAISPRKRTRCAAIARKHGAEDAAREIET